MDSSQEESGAALLRTMDGEVNEARRLASLFFATGREQVQQVVAAVQARQRVDLGPPAHKCAGGAAACGFMELADLLRTIERTADAGAWTDLDALCATLRDAFDRTQASVEAYFKGKMPPP